MNRREFFGKLIAVAAVVSAPAVWTYRKVAERFINVKDFGAIGDGVTDDTAAIQAAFDAAGGHPTYFPPGTYRADGVIFLPRPFAWGETHQTLQRRLKVGHKWRKTYPEKNIIIRSCELCGRRESKHVMLGEWDYESGPAECIEWGEPGAS